MSYNLSMVNNQNKVFTYLLVAFLIVFVGSGIYMIANRQKPAVNEENQATIKQENMALPTVAPKTGSLSLSTEAIEGVTVGENASLIISGDSQGKNIVGYDTVVQYDPAAFEFVEARSSLADFKIYPKDMNGILVLTVLKALDSKTETILAGEELATLVFKSKAVGSYDFSLMETSDKEKTDMITDNTEILLPNLNGTTVSVL
jgi:hypothetical protein